MPLARPSWRHSGKGSAIQAWIEGQSIAVEVRTAEGKYDRLPDLAAELVRLKVDVIFASSTPAALAAKRATTTIPIVIGRVADPVGSGLVTTLARPGGNITGWTHQGIELRVKYLDLLKDAVPEATRIGVLWNPANPIHGPSLKSMEATAGALKVELHPVGARDPPSNRERLRCAGPKRRARTHGVSGWDVLGSGTADHRPRGTEPNAGDVRAHGPCEDRWTHG